MSGNVHPNPGPCPSTSDGLLKFIHWNVNSLSAHDFIRISLIESLNSYNDYDVIALTETALNSEISDDQLTLNGFLLIRKDLPPGNTHGGVMIYYKNSLALRHRPDLENQTNTLVCEVSVDQKKIFVSVIYRKFGQTKTEFDTFALNLDLMCKNIKDENPLCSIYLGDFNAHSSEWYTGDDTDYEGRELLHYFTINELYQLVTEPTYLVGEKNSCIDLVLIDQPNLVINCEIIPSLHTNCHHQINQVTINVRSPPPPPFSRRKWHYDRARVDLIKRAIIDYDWVTELNLLATDPNLQVEHLTDVLNNVFINFIPYDDVIIKPKAPPWSTKNISRSYQKYRRVYKSFIRNGCKAEMTQLINSLKEDYTSLVETAKNEYLCRQSQKLSNPNTGIKSYWSILKQFLNKNKFPSIPPIFHLNKFVTDFQEKATLFNKFFVSQCTVLDTGSQMPVFHAITESILNKVLFNNEDIITLIRGLNPNKAHGWDTITIRMTQMCDSSLVIPLSIIYINCVNKGVFPKFWKMANVVPVHKKDSKQLLKNYRPISLLPVFGKIFEKLLFNNLYPYLIQNKLISERQSGFKKNDSTINQLLYICHEIMLSFDANPSKEVRAVFLDISKAFDKVWHEGLVFKLKCNGIQGDVLNLLTDFLNERCQRTLLNGKISDWAHVEAGVPQGSVLGPLLFLIYINDITVNIKSNIRIFADDVSLFKVVEDIAISHEDLQHDLNLISQWAEQWRLRFNPDLTKQAVEVIFSTKIKPPNHPHLICNNSAVKLVDEHKQLGIILDKKLSFTSHIYSKLSIARKGIGTILRLRKYLPRNILEQIFKTIVRPHIEYGDIIFHQPPTTKDFSFDTHLKPLMQKLESLQYSAALAITGAWRGTSTDKIYEELGWETLTNRRWYRRLSLFFQIAHNQAPQYLCNIITPQLPLWRRNPNNNDNDKRFKIFFSRTIKFGDSFFPSCVADWNNLDENFKRAINKKSFQNSLIKIMRPLKCNNFKILDNIGLMYLTQLRVGLNNLRQYKYDHNFADTTDPMCSAADGVEDVAHFLLSCHLYTHIRIELLNSVSRITGTNIAALDKKALVKLLLYGNEKTYSFDINRKILLSTITFIKNSNRF